MRIDGFEKLNFLSRPFWIFFLLHPYENQSKRVEWMGLNFDDYPGFQLKITPEHIYR